MPIKSKRRPLRTLASRKAWWLRITRLRRPQQLSRPSICEGAFSRLRQQHQTLSPRWKPEAARRAQASQADAAARSDEFARFRSEMLEMMCIQVLNMDQLRKDNAELKNRLAEAEAESPSRRQEPELPPGLDAHRIDTPQSRLLRLKGSQSIRMRKRRKRARNPRSIKRTIHLIHHLR